MTAYPRLHAAMDANGKAAKHLHSEAAKDYLRRDRYQF